MKKGRKSYGSMECNEYFSYYYNGMWVFCEHFSKANIH